MGRCWELTAVRRVKITLPPKSNEKEGWGNRRLGHRTEKWKNVSRATTLVGSGESEAHQQEGRKDSGFQDG